MRCDDSTDVGGCDAGTTIDRSSPGNRVNKRKARGCERRFSAGWGAKRLRGPAARNGNAEGEIVLRTAAGPIGLDARIVRVIFRCNHLRLIER
jgi:hypothetical protein